MLMLFIVLVFCATFSHATVGWFVAARARYTGASDISTANEVTLSDCQGFCESAFSANPPCVAISYESSSGNCFVKSQAGIDLGSTVTLISGWNTYVPNDRITFLYGIIIIGNYIGDLGAANKQDCAQKCRQRATCMATSSNGAANICSGKYSNGVITLYTNYYLIYVGPIQTTSTSTTSATTSTSTSTSATSATSSTSSTSLTSSTSCTTTMTSTSTTSTWSTTTTLSSTLTSSSTSSSSKTSSTTTLTPTSNVTTGTTSSTTTTPTTTSSSSSSHTTTTKNCTTQPVTATSYPECDILVASFNSVAFPFNCSTIDPNKKYIISGLKNRRRDGFSGNSKRESLKYVQFVAYRVQQIVFPTMGLSQQIPSAISIFEKMQILDLSGNQLTGSIPAVFGLLASLQAMDLSENQLTGAIPAQLSQLSNIKSFSVTGNLLTGVIPPALLAAVAANGATFKVGTNCLSGLNNQRAVCYGKAPNCRAISLDTGYLDSRWLPLWNAWAASQNDLNAFDKAANELGATHFGVREYEFQAFRYYVARRAWCMAKHPEYVYLG